MRKTEIRLDVLIIIGLIIFILKFFTGCSGSSANSPNQATKPELSAHETAPANAKTKKFPGGAQIEIKENSPADTVMTFYARLRENRFRDAFLLTNLRPAIEGLTDAEMRDLGVDFGFLANKIPADIPINGEIITGEKASVTVEMPDNETEKLLVQKINLRRENGIWTILTVDEKAEAEVRKQGKNYFFALRLNVHHEEARAMLDRIGKAQMIFSMQNGGEFGDLPTLIEKGFVPPDARTAATTGYNFDIKLDSARRQYTATATPDVYGKTGKLSFALKITSDRQPELVSRDVRGKSL